MRDKISVLIFIVSFLVACNVNASDDPEQGHFEKAAERMQAGDYDGAIKEFDKAIESTPDSSGTYCARGYAYYANGKLDQAASDFSKAMEINPDLAEAYYGRGLTYAAKDNLDQAISDYTKTIELNPEFIDAYKARAVAYYYKQEYAKAWADAHSVEQSGGSISQDLLEELKKHPVEEVK